MRQINIYEKGFYLHGNNQRHCTESICFCCNCIKNFKPRRYPECNRRNKTARFKGCPGIKLYKASKNTVEKSISIGIFQWYSVFQELEDPYYQAIRVGIEKYCADHNIHVVRAFQSDCNYPDTLKDLQGLICIGKFNKSQIKSFQKLNSNTIFVDMKTPKIYCDTINLDFQQAVTEALDYLYDLGHRKIAYLGGKEVLADNSVYFEERKDTFINFCQEHSIDHESFIYEGDYSAESGYNMTKQMIADGDLPTAIFSASDPLAIGAMRALYENGYKIPDDISIIGFDDISVASFQTLL